MSCYVTVLKVYLNMKKPAILYNLNKLFYSATGSGFSCHGILGNKYFAVLYTSHAFSLSPIASYALARS